MFVRRTCAVALIAFMASLNAAHAADYTIAILQSLTGPAASIGVPVRDGALLAAEELNANHFLGAGNTLKAVVADEANNREQTVTAINRFAADPTVMGIVGPLSGAVVMAGVSAANDLKISTFSIASTPEIFKVGPWGFVIIQSPPVAIPYLGSYAVNTLKVKNCVAIGINDNPAALLQQKAFVDYVTEHGGKFVSQEGIKMSDSDFGAIATKIASMDNLDCIFISHFAPQAANIIRQLREAGLSSKVRIMGYNSLASPDFIAKGGNAVEGVFVSADWVPGGDSKMGRAFEAAYTAKSGSAPDNWAAIGYSAMRVMATAIKEAGSTPTRESVRDAMARTKDVPVVVGQGLYSIDSDRLSHYGMSILMVKGGKFVLAPK